MSWRPEDFEVRKIARQRWRKTPAGKDARRRWRNRRRAGNVSRIRAEKTCRGCSICGETDWRCLDFHHIDPQTKEFVLGNGQSTQKPWELLQAEIAKCDILCANCHRKHHIKGNEEELC